MIGFSNSIQSRNQAVIKPIQQSALDNKITAKRHHVKQPLEPVKKTKFF